MGAHRIAILDERTEPGQSQSLGTAPLVEQLALALARRATGTLTLQQRAGTTHLVYLHRGVPAKVRTADVVSPLDETLLDMGLLDTDTLIDSYERACDAHKLLGHVLLERHLIDERTLATALRRQVAAKITRLFGLPDRTRVDFHEGVNLLDQYGGPELIHCDPLPLIMTGARALDAHPHLEATFARLTHQRLALARDADPARLDLRLETPVVDLLAKKALRLDELLASHTANERVVRRTIYALALAGWLDVVDDEPVPLPEGETAHRQPGPSAVEQPTTGCRQSSMLTVEGISAMAARIHEASIAEVMGVPQGAPLDEIASVYLSLTRRWHPNRLDPSLAALRPTVERIYSRFIEAYASLSHQHATSRRRLRRPSQNRSAPPPGHKPRSIRAQELYKEAHRLHRSGRNAEAFALVRRVIELSRSRPEYLGLFAWLQALDLGEPPQLAPGATSNHYATPIRLLNRALTDSPNHSMARYYRGVLLRKTGHLEDAAADFRRVVATDPDHLDAARELRLMELRARAGAPS